jgi:hypothetical protein
MSGKEPGYEVVSKPSSSDASVAFLWRNVVGIIVNMELSKES